MTATPSITPTFTATPTPLTYPFHVEVSAYNEAGERVRSIYSGSSQQSGAQATLSGASLLAGSSGFSLIFPGLLNNGGHQLGWDGSNDQGQPLSGGIYYLHIETMDPFGSVSTLSQPVNVLAAPASAQISVFNSAGELVASLAPPAGLSGLGLASLELSSMVPGSQALKINLRGGNASAVLSWDGRKADGGFVSSGTYSVLVKDGSYRAEFSFTVLDAPLAGSASPFAVPNPAHAQDAVLRIQLPGSSPFLRRVCLYSLAGELIATQAAEAGVSGIDFDIHGLAAGIYVASVSDAAAKRSFTIKICIAK